MTDIEKLQKEISDTQYNLDVSQGKVRSLKSELAKAETENIGLKITMDALKEQLRRAESKVVDVTQTERQKDIERFKGIVADLLKKV